MLTIQELIKRSGKRIEEEGDYWAKAHHFLASIRFSNPKELTVKQRNWLHEIRAKLTQPWE